MNRRYIGLDLHLDRIYVTVLSIADNTVKQFEISTSAKDLDAFLATLRLEDEVALEATRGHWYYVDRLTGRVHSISVANPAKLQLLNRNAKNDRNDSLGLALKLAQGTLPTVWIPCEETRQDRQILHYRATLVKELVRLKNQIRALLAENGVNWQGSEIQGVQHFLVKLKGRLPAVSLEILTNQLEQVCLLEVRIKQIEASIVVRAARWPEVALLMTIRGIGVLTAFTIMAVIGSIDRFETPGSLANYSGLVPRQHSSAGKTRQGKITKAGSKMLRWALTEAVQSLCKVDGVYRNLCKRLERKKKGKGIAATACARKLLTAIWCMLTRGQEFDHAEPVLTERKAQRREERVKTAARFVEERKKRQNEVLVSQLALIQDLTSRGMHMPVPRQMLPSFGRSVKAATG